MSSKQQQIMDIPLDEYIAQMNITSNPPNSPNLLETNSETSTLRTDSDHKEPTKQNAATPKSSLYQQNTKTKVTFRNRNPDDQRNMPMRNREPYFRSPTEIDARHRINQLRNRSRLERRFFFEQVEESTGPSRPSITPPSSMQRQAVVTSGPSWEQMLPFEQLQQMATSAWLLSTLFDLPVPRPFNDPALFRR